MKINVKRFILIIFVVSVLFLVNMTFVAAADVSMVIKLTIGKLSYTKNGDQKTSDVAPFISSDNRTMVPIRLISEALGAKVDWNADTQTVTLTLNDKILRVIINQQLSNNMGTAVIRDNRTFVPVRYVSEQLGAKVDWDGMTQTVIISSTVIDVSHEDEIIKIRGLVNRINGSSLIEDDIGSYIYYYENPNNIKWLKIIARYDNFASNTPFLNRDQVCEWYYEHNETPPIYVGLRFAYIHGAGVEERYYFKEQKLIRYIDSQGMIYDFRSEDEISAGLREKAYQIHIKALLMFTS